jgi:hypothetical protein
VPGVGADHILDEHPAPGHDLEHVPRSSVGTEPSDQQAEN